MRAARAHGMLSEPDHEIGDLQGMLFACWERLSPEDRDRLWVENEDLRGWLNDLTPADLARIEDDE
jgi:hypothetical protein